MTVTPNAALDKTLDVPNFSFGLRHRCQQGLVLPGGKGINVARALKILGEPVVATGLAGGATGTRIVEELTREGILNDFVRIAQESRTSTIIVDPTAGRQTEINEYGPEVSETEVGMLAGKLHYLATGADLVVLAGSLPRRLPDDWYAHTIRDLRRRKVAVVLDAEGEPLRLGVSAEPDWVAPNQYEAEELVGHEFGTDQDFVDGLSEIAELGARNVLVTNESGCFALLRDGGATRRFHVQIERVEAVSTVGSGDAFLAGFLAGRSRGRGIEESLRQGVGAGVANVLTVGAGRFDPREATRHAARAVVTEL